MRAAKVDKNQPVVVAALRALGFKVQPTHVVGRGVPDFIVQGESHDSCRLMWIELKCAGGKLTPDEREWLDDWSAGRGYVTVAVAYNVRDILACFLWTHDRISKALHTIQEWPTVKRALADARRKYGEIDDILESLL